MIVTAPGKVKSKSSWVVRISVRSGRQIYEESRSSGWPAVGAFSRPVVKESFFSFTFASSKIHDEGMTHARIHLSHLQPQLFHLCCFTRKKDETVCYLSGPYGSVLEAPLTEVFPDPDLG